jgi:hypothetical protein
VDKELLVYAREDGREVSILVPKLRGTGYLKVPFGHHQNSALSEVGYEIGYDLFGLDGSLDVQTGFLFGKRDEIVARIMPVIAAHYGMTWRLVDGDEYRDRHPIKT